jgi:enoyl-CoA hydratase
MSTSDGAVVDYRVDGPAAWIVMNRPGAANAQSSQLITELDTALDRADADDAVRVVVIAGEGKHFSAGHDLKEILGGTDPWSRSRSTIEGTLRHEQVMYFDKCVRLRDFRKPTIAAVQGACAAAGLMLAAMCDMIVAADDARFSNPVLRMSGAAVELLVEPWELGPRKAKEFLLCQLVLDAPEAERLGLVNRVVPRDELWPHVQEMAETIALVPPITAQAVKDTINRMVDIQGQREHWRYHFMVHQFVSTTETAVSMRAGRSNMDDVKAQQGAPQKGDG